MVLGANYANLGLSRLLQLLHHVVSLASFPVPSLHDSHACVFVICVHTRAECIVSTPGIDAVDEDVVVNPPVTHTFKNK